ncbi:MAG: hypothetical protein ACE5FT_06605 [Candidatus Nanoarchaeia archaeon]
MGCLKDSIGLEKLSISSTLPGTLLGAFFVVSANIMLILFGLVSGVMFYVAVKEYLRDDISLAYFLTGQGCFILLMFVVQNINNVPF